MDTTPARKRLSRAESRLQTRQYLLEAAAAVIPRKGYHAASVEDIAAEAGFSRGAFYSNFDSKDELFATLLRQMADDENEQLDAIFDRGGSAEEMRLNIRDFYTHTYREKQQFVLYAEARIHAARDEAFRQRLLELEHITRKRMTGFVERYCQAHDLQHDGMSYEEIAIGLMALIEGVTFTQMLDPDSVDDNNATAVLTSFFDAIINDGARGDDR